MTRTHFLLLLLASLLVGCADQSKGYPVTGVVTLDGTPIPDGSITFRPVDPRQRPESADIVDGTFKVHLPAGKSRVEVHAARPSATTVAGMGPTMEDYIPEKYKGPSSVLEADIKVEGNNLLEYSLVSGKKPAK